MIGSCLRVVAVFLVLLTVSCGEKQPVLAPANRSKSHEEATDDLPMPRLAPKVKELTPVESVGGEVLPEPRVIPAPPPG